MRAQIILALTLAFVASFALLGVATVRLTEQAQSVDRQRAARTTAVVLARGIDESPDRAQTLVDALLEEGSIAGVEVVRPGLEPSARGLVGIGSSTHAPLSNGGTVRLWLRPIDRATTTPLTNLLVMYVAITGAAILLLAYLALTYLIVRPVEAVTRASERLAGGAPHVRVPVRGAAEVARLALAFNDMAAQLRRDRASLEEKIRDLELATNRLRSAQDQLLRSERLASVGRLAAGIAHEVGNPLAAILGLNELLGDPGLAHPDRAEFVRRITGEIERIQKIIRDLLDFARHDSDVDERASSDLRKVVDDAVSLVSPQKDLHKVAIERRFAEVPNVRGSADRLTQLVLNLLLNAADAIGGAGQIEIEISQVEDGKFVALVVSDTGPGIAPEVVDHLFEPFVTTKPAGSGTGLGLAVCHTLVERLFGTIRAENRRQGGARFEVRLPVAG